MVRERADGVWQVLDITVIETLTGFGEGRQAAEALARDYAEQHDHPAAAPAGARTNSAPRRDHVPHLHRAAAQASEPATGR